MFECSCLGAVCIQVDQVRRITLGVSDCRALTVMILRYPVKRGRGNEEAHGLVIAIRALRPRRRYVSSICVQGTNRYSPQVSQVSSSLANTA